MGLQRLFLNVLGSSRYDQLHLFSNKASKCTVYSLLEQKDKCKVLFIGFERWIMFLKYIALMHKASLFTMILCNDCLFFLMYEKDWFMF